MSRPPIPRFVIVRASATIAGLALVSAGIFMGIRYFQRQSEALDKLEAHREEITEAARRDVVEGHGVESSAQHFNASKANLNEAASKLHGDDRRAIVASEKVLEAFKQKGEDYGKAYLEFKESGMVRSSTLPALESIHERDELLKRCDEANAALEESLKNVQETARSEFQKQGLSEQQSRKWAASFAQGANVDMLLALRGCDREMVEVFGEILALLEKSWGSWKPAANDKVIFDKPEEARRYNALRARIVEISSRQQALQMEVLAKAKSNNLAPQSRPVNYAPEFIGPIP